MAIGVLGLAGCSFVETTLPERGFAMNVGAGNLREDVILLNLVRASQFEPMNFVALSKYNGSGVFEGGVSANRNIGLLFEILNKGPIAAGTTATQSVAEQSVTPNVRLNSSANFDLAPLDNKEFYAGFLAQLELPTINLLVNAGLPRELVLHSIIGAARVTHRDGTVYLFNNDPANDGWLGDYGPSAHERCRQLAEERSFHPAFAHSAWRGEHGNDCSYQKFLYFLRAAIEYGITTETTEVPNPNAAKDKSAPRTVTRVRLCYDAGVAREYGRRVNRLAACGMRGRAGGSRAYTDLGPNLRSIQPVLRSSYAVYQFYGRILATDTVSRVRLIDAGTPRLPTGDRKILTVNREGLDCFARALHSSGRYCVPNVGANNTKEVFFLLNALVYLSTTRSALPTTSTVQLAP